MGLAGRPLSGQYNPLKVFQKYPIGFGWPVQKGDA